MDLKDMQRRVREVNEANGWFDADRGFTEGIALLHSEVTEALEAYCVHGLSDYTKVRWTPHLKLTDESGPILARFLMGGPTERPALAPFPWQLGPDEWMILAREGHAKPEGVGSEFADILIRLLDETERQNVAIETWDTSHVSSVGDPRPREFSTRINYFHGLIHDWWVEYDPSYAHTLFRNLLRASKTYGIDLMWEFERKLAYNATRSPRPSDSSRRRADPWT